MEVDKLVSSNWFGSCETANSSVGHGNYMCGSMSCDKTALFRVAFYCDLLF